jgi:hypothetical protein
MLLHPFLLLLFVLLLTRPFKVASEDQSRAGNPLIQTLVELIPVNKKLEFVELGVCRKWIGGRRGSVRCAATRRRSRRGLTAKIWIV